jgi:hypothetical protein
MSDLYKTIMDAANRRMDAAAIHLTNSLKETLSLPVPRLLIRGKVKPKYFVKRGKILTQVRASDVYHFVPYTTSTGKTVYVEPATRGAAPRKFEGRLRAGHTWERLAGRVNSLVRRVGTNVKYARTHEEGSHPYFTQTLERERTELERLLGQSI